MHRFFAYQKLSLAKDSKGTADAWGGRVSDKYLTEYCGILANYCLETYIALTDRGFDIHVAHLDGEL